MRWFRKAPSEPPSSGALGGAFRRSCLSPRSGRVLRRPSDASSAGESSAKRMTGEAGVASLPTFLATQESRPAAGPGPGQRNAKQRKAAGPHQRTANQTSELGPDPRGGRDEWGMSGYAALTRPTPCACSASLVTPASAIPPLPWPRTHPPETASPQAAAPAGAR